jgi:hypothetical protein
MDDLGSFVTVKLFDAEKDPWWCTKEEWTEMTKDRPAYPVEKGSVRRKFLESL